MAGRLMAGMTASGDMPHPNSVEASKTPHPWNLAARLGFRFAFCYLALSCFWMAEILRFFVIVFGFHHAPHGLLDPLWHRVVPWIAVHLLRFRAGAGAPGSSDSLYEYLLVFCHLWLATAAALVWSVIDRRRMEYRVPLEWLRRAVSLLLACMLFFYGSDKVFPLQFGRLSLVDLSERVGDLTGFDMLCSAPDDAVWKCDFRIERPDQDSVHLEGRFNGVERARFSCTACRQKLCGLRAPVSIGCGWSGERWGVFVHSHVRRSTAQTTFSLS